ncbi:DUF6531 domain-containing protein [Streptomyces sp. NPDC127092]|uniref:DUF6531 domain-containing protein n=1 Tax=Streptomyces sp. NPDC127092 TaxID=3347135 RepID=UPI0036490EDB
MATGRMLLPQTDSRWFGPGWSSTVDQRLEIDAEGVLLVSDDGSILAFPHPAPGVPVLPTHGTRRCALDRDASDGTYTVTDPETGLVRHFATVGHGDGGGDGHGGSDRDEAALVQIDDCNGNWILGSALVTRRGVSSMSARGRLVGETLSRLGPLRWFRLSAGRHPLYDYYQVPYVGWRFDAPRIEYLQLIEQAVRATPTAVEWSLDTTRRNWLLAPSVLLEDNETDGTPAAFDERVNLAMRDQDFCIRALGDLDAIIQTLQDLITRHNKGEN